MPTSRRRPALAAAHEHRAAPRVEVELGQIECFPDAQPGTPQHHDQSAGPGAVKPVAAAAHHCDDLLSARRVSGVAGAFAAWRAPSEVTRDGGGLIGRPWPRDDDERKRAEDAGYDVAKVLTHDDLVKGENCFFSATGVTDGDVLRGVRYEGARGATTHSLVMRSRSGTVRIIESRHDRTKLRLLTGYRLQ